MEVRVLFPAQQVLGTLRFQAILLEMDRPEEVILYPGVHLFVSHWQAIEQTAISRAVSLSFLYAVIAANKEYMADLVLAVIMGVAFFFGAKVANGNDLVTDPLA